MEDTLINYDLIRNIKQYVFHEDYSNKLLGIQLCKGQDLITCLNLDIPYGDKRMIKVFNACITDIIGFSIYIRDLSNEENKQYLMITDISRDKINIDTSFRKKVNDLESNTILDFIESFIDYEISK